MKPLVLAARAAACLAFASTVATSFAACGGTSSNETPPPPAHASVPEMVNAGGPILTAPQIVTVTFPNDALRDRLEQFGDMMGRRAGGHK